MGAREEGHERRRVVLTGAAGRIGSCSVERLAGRWDLVATDRRAVEGVEALDVSAHPADQQIRPEDPPRPANLYGATKAWSEALGAWIASSSSTSVVALRIGYFDDEPPAGAEATPRNLSAWISPDDCAELLRAAVEGPVEGFMVVNGVSANRFRKGAYGSAERRLGYEPRDDAWARSS